MSASRASSSSASATAFSASSPAAWPCSSLRILRPSTSQIEEHRVGQAANPREGPLALQRVLEAAPVGEPGQRVGERQLAERVRGSLELALVGLALELVAEQRAHHGEQLQVPLAVVVGLVRDRAEAADPVAAGDLERHTDVALDPHRLAQSGGGVVGVGLGVVAEPRRAVGRHVHTEARVERHLAAGREPVAALAAGVDDPHLVLVVVEVGDEQGAAVDLVLEHLEHAAGRLGEAGEAACGEGMQGVDRVVVHPSIVCGCADPAPERARRPGARQLSCPGGPRTAHDHPRQPLRLGRARRGQRIRCRSSRASWPGAATGC